jgi:hypothetical protein
MLVNKKSDSDRKIGGEEGKEGQSIHKLANRGHFVVSADFNCEVITCRWFTHFFIANCLFESMFTFVLPVLSKVSSQVQYVNNK